jgi:uncharacterized protein (DUF488 family)
VEPTPPSIHIFTIGHSNRSLQEFLNLLKESQIAALVDIRRFPSSRKFPHFNRDALASLLETQGIEYLWFENLGGFRHSGTNRSSPNTGLESPGFRNYADHMMTNQFHVTVHELLSIASRRSTAIMCTERFFWKCHRRLLSDFLVAQGTDVTHIVEPGSLKPHRLTTGAILREDGQVIYPSYKIARDDPVKSLPTSLFKGRRRIFPPLPKGGKGGF